MEKLKFNEAIRHMLDRWVGDLIQNTKAQIVKAGVHSLEDVRTCPQRLVALSPEVEEERKQAKAFLYEHALLQPDA